MAGRSNSGLAYMPVFVDEDDGKTYQIVVESEAEEATAGLSEEEKKCIININIS